MHLSETAHRRRIGQTCLPSASRQEILSDQRYGILVVNGSLPTFGGTKSMTKSAHTTPPPDAAARRRAPPVLTYSVEQLPSLDAAFYNGARAELSKVTELTVPPRDAKAFEVRGTFLPYSKRRGPASRRPQPLERA